MGKSVNLGSSERVSEIQSVLRLRSVPGVGTRTLWRILNRFGSGRRALAARPVELDAVAGMRCSEALASPGLDDGARRVWLALSERSLRIDDVASGADLQSARVLSALTILQVSGLVVQESGMRFRRAS